MNGTDTPDDIFSVMVVYGLLNYENGAVHIPNHELREEFASTIRKDTSMGYFHSLSVESGRILEATLKGDADTVAAALTGVHNITPIRAYNNEAELSLVVFFAYLSAIDRYVIDSQ